jgi:hypothetical protein
MYRGVARNAEVENTTSSLTRQPHLQEITFLFYGAFKMPSTQGTGEKESGAADPHSNEMSR